VKVGRRWAGAGSAKVLGVGFSITIMERTTARRRRARLMEARVAKAADREARERQNIGDLAEFLVQTAKVDEVDGWLAERIEKARREADAKRERHRVAAGKALQAIRFRGETVAGIAAQAGVMQAKVREYLKVAAAAGESAQADEQVSAPEQSLRAVPTETVDGDGGHDGLTVVGAQ
jgi:hypothetical protein